MEAPHCDEIHTEALKSLSGDSVSGLTDQGGGPSIENGDRVPTLGAHSPGKLHSMILWEVLQEYEARGPLLTEQPFVTSSVHYFMTKILRRSQGLEGLQFEPLNFITILGDNVLLARLAGTFSTGVVYRVKHLG